VIDPDALAARLDDVRSRIADASRRARRGHASVRLVAVSKTFPAGAVRAAAAAGQVDFGENKLQEALTKIGDTADLRLRWHLLGHLQSNKARKAGACVDVIHSVDTASLLPLIDRGAREAGRSVEALVQVDLAGEVTKFGCRPEEVRPIFEAGARLTNVRVIGLMLLPPATPNPDGARPYFSALRRLRDDLLAAGVPESSLRELSMGMSHDFEVAVEEGATIVRVGTAIFGSRPMRTP
jgi:pyridoxal phosphate enzyme (YggS family)